MPISHSRWKAVLLLHDNLIMLDKGCCRSAIILPCQRCSRTDTLVLLLAFDVRFGMIAAVTNAEGNDISGHA